MAFDYKNSKEELWNAITHGIGLLLSIPALVMLIVVSAQQQSVMKIVTFTIFGSSMVLLFLMSTLLHSVPYRFKHLFSILDHSAIYILIAGTYTPYLLVGLQGALGWTLFGIIWGLAVLGVLFKVFFIHRFEAFSIALYIAMGWLIVFAIKPLYVVLLFEGMIWLVIGGILYTFGAIFYAWRKIPFNHAIWHVFVIAGSASMYVSVLFYL